MEFKRFTHKVKQGVADFLGESVSVEVKQVVKNNNVVLDGLIIKEKEYNAAPTIYLNDYFKEYEAGKPVSTIVYEILKFYETQKPCGNINMDFFLHYEMIQNRIVYKVINYERNKELLKEVPHIPFLNAAIVFYCLVEHDVLENATILIYNSHCHMWNVSTEDIYEAAKRNTQRLLAGTVQSIEEVVKDRLALEENISPPAFPMYVLSNVMKLFGAVSMLYDNVLDMFAAQFGQDVYILPSSIHEVILIPDSGDLDSERLEEMVYEVNHTQLDTEEILSDRIYKYDRRSRKIIFALCGEAADAAE